MSSFVFSGTHFGSFTMLPVSGLLASSVGGWPSVFYVSGFATLLWVLVWCLFGANSPEDHRSISKEEKEYIIKSLSDTTSEKVNCLKVLFHRSNSVNEFAAFTNSLAWYNSVGTSVDTHSSSLYSKLGHEDFTNKHAIICHSRTQLQH